jgi:hypothetical protein
MPPPLPYQLQQVLADSPDVGGRPGLHPVADYFPDSSDSSFYTTNKKMEMRMKNGDQISVSAMFGTEKELNLATKAERKGHLAYL